MNPKIIAFAKRPILRQFGGGLTSQVLQSAANFGVSMIVARTCSKPEYGLYTVVFTTLIVITTFQNALFNVPFQVVAATKTREDRLLFTSGILINQLILFSGISLITFVVSLAYCANKGKMNNVPFITIFLFSAFLWGMREFVRTINSSHLDAKALISGEIAYSGIALAGAFLFWKMGVLDSKNAVISLAFACLFGSIFGLVVSRFKFTYDYESIRTSLHEISKYSGWAVIGAFILFIQTQCYVYFLSILTTLSQTAEINASKMFFMPIGFLIGGVSRILLPKGSEILNNGGGHPRLMKMIAMMILVLLSLAIIYCVILCISYKRIVEFTIGDKYIGIGQYFLLWACYFCLQVIRSPLSSALQVLKRFRYTAMVGGIDALITILFCLVGIRACGAKGVIIGLIAGEILGILLYNPAVMYRLTRKKKS